MMVLWRPDLPRGDPDGRRELIKRKLAELVGMVFLFGVAAGLLAAGGIFMAARSVTSQGNQFDSVYTPTYRSN